MVCFLCFSFPRTHECDESRKMDYLAIGILLVEELDLKQMTAALALV